MTAPAPRPSTARWRLALGMLTVLAGVALYRGAVAIPEAGRAETPVGVGVAIVQVKFKRPDAPAVERRVPWSEGQTVADATRIAAVTRWRGEGAMALFVEIDGVANQGADALNWQYEVNGRYATEGAGAVELRPGDRVLWKLAPYE